MPYFQGKSTPLSEQFQYNLALFAITGLNPLTEDFTECDMRSLEQFLVMDRPNRKKFSSPPEAVIDGTIRIHRIGVDTLRS